MSSQINGNGINLYQNPDRVSLEKLELFVRKDGILQHIPALSQAWTEARSFLEYEVPKIYDVNGKEIIGAKDYWIQLVTNITNDLSWLLRLPFYKFWSNVIYNPTISDCLVSCLQELPTFYNLETFPNDETMRDLIEILRHVVFVTFARLVTSKESKEEFMSHEVHGNFLYDKFLLTVPMMLDICQLYGRENRRLVKKIISTAIKLQPSYNRDLEETAIFLIKVFKTVEERFEDQPLGATAVPLSEREFNHQFTIDELQDLVIHLLDVSSNISIFLDCYPPARDLLNKESVVNEIVHLYGNTIPEMYKRLEPFAHQDETVVRYTELRHRLDVTRVELLKIFRTIIYQNIALILEAPNPSQVPGASEHAEQFIHFLDKAVTEREFMLDYHASYPIETDLDLVSQISPDIDPVKCNFIRRSVYAEFGEHERNNTTNFSTTNHVTDIAAIPSSSQQTVILPVSNNISKDKTNISSTKKNPEELASLISEVKDILCDLGEGFIEMCLKHYNYDAAAVINAVFENSLPETLKSLDRSLPYIPPDSEESAASNDRLFGNERLNVFDNDEFDVMTRDTIDKSRIHKGKRKDTYKNFGQLLDDKSYRKDTSEIYQKYSVIQDEYEDEYDDTYDSHDVGPRGVDEPLEMDGRIFTTPRVLRGIEKREVDDDEEEENDDEVEREDGSSKSQNDRFNFVQDPAEMRARAEQRKLSKRGGGGGGGGGNRGAKVDVIGKPKGQGNDKNVLINRDRKNTNKASRGNHNRRTGAEYKRRQGMIP